VLALAAATLAWLSIRSIGGQTGDVLGALQQVSESAVLLVAISFVSG
jgi:adenosylcobinamide-GDP ribazoletransferase